ncbi:YscQ/HrcQ family type III secretion apparatus protein [Chromobacterium subtsugae]|uniref:YscQ/HrcQ family type III secretion apparatus protein n=1 Tax=Chromobacterium subtsugae TaxID=251747 RepID=UPI000640CDC8|nr:YscQ/HrcQ family type III secretion apparatus protein [Chromobacterium subtsugae]
MLKLRRVEGETLALRQAAEIWAGQGWEAEIAYPPRHGRWLEVADEDGRWQGWLEPRAWLESMAPDLAVLASGAGAERQAGRLIAASPAPLHWPMPDLPRGRLRAGAERDGGELPQRPLLRVATPQGPVWLARVEAPRPAAMPARRFDWLSAPLAFGLGHSHISQALLRSVRGGDVLLVQQTASLVACHGRTVGRYQRSDEGIIMEWQMEEAAERDEPALADIEQLPVRLEFVLQQSRVTLAELRQLCQGRLLPLQAGAERQVEVHANGALLGRGELVQLDGQLGVEVTQWRDGPDDVE